MKLAYIYDCSTQNSYYVKNQTSYDFVENKPYIHQHSITPSLHVTGWNFPFLWGDGCFLNLEEWVDRVDFPDEDFDMILYSNERLGLDDDNYTKYSVQRLRDRYPNAKIVAYLKEVELSVHNREERSKNRIHFLKSCDGIVAHGVDSMKGLKDYTDMEELIGKKIHYVSHPVNINLYYDTFYSSNKQESIFAYLPNPIHRRAETYDFANYIGEKYNIPVRYKKLEINQKFDYLSLKEFVELWSPSSFQFNLDPSSTHPGQQAIQTANVGSINIGGLNESHHLLFPETATCDKKILEEKFEEYLKDVDKRFQVIEYAWEKLNEHYSFKVIKKQLTDLYEAVK
jgi:hypothetical protein